MFNWTSMMECGRGVWGRKVLRIDGKTCLIGNILRGWEKISFYAIVAEHSNIRQTTIEQQQHAWKIYSICIVNKKADLPFFFVVMLCIFFYKFCVWETIQRSFYRRQTLSRWILWWSQETDGRKHAMHCHTKSSRYHHIPCNAQKYVTIP